MTKELTITVGIPASGKSTYLASLAKEREEDGWTTVIISRDAIRFSMIQPGEDYFKRENAVFAEFVRQINEAMELGIDWVYVDATHINEASRRKLLKKLRPDPHTSLAFLEFNCPVEVALERNTKKREGLAKVPDEAIINMEHNKTSPENDSYPEDNYGFSHIFYHKIKMFTDQKENE